MRWPLLRLRKEHAIDAFPVPMPLAKSLAASNPDTDFPMEPAMRPLFYGANSIEGRLYVMLAQVLRYQGNAGGKLNQLLTQGGLAMTKLDELQADVAAEKTVIDSAVALLNGLSEKIAELEPTQAAIDQLAAEVKDQTQELADAVAANTPPTAAPTT